MQKLVELECFTNNLEQYGIRKNIIISGIPDSVDNNQLEESVLKFLLTLTLMWQVMIEACHRIGKKDSRIGSTKTIIRFPNRKHAKQALYNKKKHSQVKKIHI